MWLHKQVERFPTGTKSIVVTHLTNIAGAFPQLASGLRDGEALIFGPDGKGQALLVARVKIEEVARDAFLTRMFPRAMILTRLCR